MAGKELNRVNEEPSGCRRDGPLEVFGEGTVPIEPCQGALRDPAAPQDLEVNHPGIAGGHLVYVMRPSRRRTVWRNIVPRLREAGYCRWTLGS